MADVEDHIDFTPVGGVVSTWRDVAMSAGAPQAEIRRMASAFEHDDLPRALVL